MRKAFTRTVSELLQLDERCKLILCDIGVFGFQEVANVKPDSVLNIGILEQATIGVAAGFAMDGRIPIVHSIAPFLVERCLEQLKIDFGYQCLSGKFVSVGASFDYAALGCTHHCPADIQSLLGIPEFEIVVPGTGEEFTSLFRASYDNANNTYYRLSEFSNTQTNSVAFGKASLLKQGSEGTVIAIGPTLDLALSAIDGLDLSLVYVTSIRPFDAETLRDATRSRKLFIIEPFYQGTLYPQVIESFPGLSVKISGKGVPRKFLQTYGAREELQSDLGFVSSSIREEMEEFFRE
jgi:transketolase